MLQALSGKQTLFSLQEMLAEAASKGAEGTPLADTLRGRIEVAEKWEQRAAQFLADAEDKKQALDTLEVSISPLHTSSLHKLHVRMQSLPRIVRHVQFLIPTECNLRV